MLQTERRTPKKTCLNDMPLIWCFSVKPLNCFFQTVSIKYSQSAPMHHRHLHHQSLGFFFFFFLQKEPHWQRLSFTQSCPLLCHFVSARDAQTEAGWCRFPGSNLFSFSRTGEPLAWRIFVFISTFSLDAFLGYFSNENCDLSSAGKQLLAWAWG